MPRSPRTGATSCWLAAPRSQEVICHLPGPAVGTSRVVSVRHLALFSWEAQIAAAVPSLVSTQRTFQKANLRVFVVSIWVSWPAWSSLCSPGVLELALITLLSHPRSECCLYMHRCRVIRWSTGNLSGTVSLKDLISHPASSGAAIANNSSAGAGGLHEPLPRPC